MGTKKPLPRRTVLRAGAATLALPTLDAMYPTGLRAETKDRPPARIVLLHRGLGTYHPHLVPDKTGPDYAPTRYLKNLEAHRGKFTLFSGIAHLGYPNSHTTSAATFTGVGPEGVARGDDIRNSVSLDQSIAEKIGDATRVRSLTLNSMGGAASLSWNRKGVPVPKDGNRSSIFKRLFIDGTPKAIQHEIDRLAHGHSILDNMRSQLKSLRAELGAPDRDRMELLETSIREAEGLLKQEQAWITKPKPKPKETMEEFTDRSANWVDSQTKWYGLIRLALQTDSTRIIVFGIGEHNNQGVPGLEIGHHDASHHGKDPAKIEQFARYEEKDYQNFAGFLDQLAGTEEPGGTLLDHTQVLLTSNLGDASAHASSNLPTFLAGGGFKHRGHVKFDEESNYPLSNLYLRMLREFDPRADQFGSSTETYSGIG